MKSLFYLLLIGGAATGVYFWINKKKSINQANVSIDNTRIEPGVLNTKFIFDVSIINPSNDEESINSITADVVYNNTPFGKINYLHPIHIAPQSKTQIQVELNESNIDLIKNFPALLSSSFSGIKILLDGFINTNLGAIPFQKVTTII